MQPITQTPKEMRRTLLQVIRRNASVTLPVDDKFFFMFQGITLNAWARYTYTRYDVDKQPDQEFHCARTITFYDNQGANEYEINEDDIFG